MRQASETPEFPYESPIVCYIFVDADGDTSQLSFKKWGAAKSSAQTAYEEAINGKGHIYAVWPGRYSSDCFAIDDLKLFGKIFGFATADASDFSDWVEDPQNIHYTIQPYNRSSYKVSIYATVTNDDKLSYENVKLLADYICTQKGWNRVMGYGVSYSSGKDGTTKISFSVLRSSVRPEDRPKE